MGLMDSRLVWFLSCEPDPLWNVNKINLAILRQETETLYPYFVSPLPTKTMSQWRYAHIAKYLEYFVLLLQFKLLESCSRRICKSDVIN